MPDIGIIRAFFQYAEARGSKSTVMAPLSTLVTLLVAATAYMAVNDVDETLLAIAGIFCCLVITFWLVAYAYFARKDPELLRSERFLLTKAAMEKGLLGDNLHGLHPSQPDRPLLGVTPAEAPFASPSEEAAND